MYDSRFQHLILIWTHRNKQWMRAVWWCLVWIRLELGTVLTRPFLASSIHSSEWKLSTMNWSPLLAHLKNRSAFVILYLSHTSNEPATCLGTLTSHCHGVRSGRWEKIGRTVERCPRSPAVLMRNSCADWHESFQNFKWSQYVCSVPEMVVRKRSLRCRRMNNLLLPGVRAAPYDVQVFNPSQSLPNAPRAVKRPRSWSRPSWFHDSMANASKWAPVGHGCWAGSLALVFAMFCKGLTSA